MQIGKTKAWTVLIGVFLFSSSWGLVASFSGQSAGSSLEDGSIRAQVRRAVSYLGKKQRPDGSIADPSRTFDVWETINAVLAISSWPEEVAPNGADVMAKAVTFLKASEGSQGMVSHGSRFANSYCLETSTEYIRARLALSAREDPDTVKKLLFVRDSQFPPAHGGSRTSLFRRSFRNFLP